MRASRRAHDAHGTGFVVATLALAACGTPLPESVDGDPVTPSGVDASVVTETSTLDAAAESEATTDGAPADGGLPDGCAQVITESFAQLPSSPWTTTLENGGAVSHAPDGGPAGTGALQAEVSASGSSTAAQLSREIIGPLPKSLRLGFAMRVAATNAGYAELGCTLQLRASDEQTFISFQPEATANNLAFDSTKKLNGTSISTGSSEKIAELDTNHWYIVEVRLDGITTAGGHVVVSVDGMKRYERDAMFPAAPEAIRVKCGIDYGASGAAATVLVDDVALALCE